PGAAGLGELVLVVGEDQVEPAAVDVELVAEVAAGHGGALDVPAGPARAPRAGPGGVGRLLRLGGLPQREVARVALAARVGVVGRLHVVRALPGQAAVLGVGGDVEVDVTGAVGR